MRQVALEISTTWRGTGRAPGRRVLSSLVSPRITPCQQSLDLVKTLEDLVRDSGRAFRDRAVFQPASEPHRERMHIAPDFEVWMLSWLPGHATAIHDHGGAVTATTVLSGTVLEERFVRVNDLEARPIWMMARRPGDFDLIAATAIHRVRSIGHTVTLHLHAPACAEGRTFQAVDGHGT
jgi:hypothetical protein